MISVAITFDGRRAVSTALYDKSLRLWDLDTGKEIAAFTGNHAMSACTAAANERTVVVGEDSGRLHFLSLVEADDTKSKIEDTKILLLQSQEQRTSAADSSVLQGSISVNSKTKSLP